MAKSRRPRVKSWTKEDLAELQKYSKDTLAVAKITRLLKRTAGALRQKTRILGITIGHRR